MHAIDSGCVLVRPITNRDLEVIARWHCQLLPHGLFPRLGEKFVRRWHATFRATPHGIAMIAEQVGAAGPVPVGFLVGSTDHVGHVDEVVRRYRLRLGAAGLLALLARPRLSLHFLRTRGRTYLRRLFKRVPGRAVLGNPTSTLGAERTTGGQVAVIAALVVDPTARGRGIGAALVTEFLVQARAAGTPRAHLVTLVGAAGAGPFYELLGWIAVSREPSRTRDGDMVLLYEYDLRQELRNGTAREDAAYPAPAEQKT